MTQIWTYFLVDTRVPALMTFTTGLKQMIFFDGGPFQLRLSISRINSSVKWWGCKRQGHGDKGPVIACPEINTERSWNVFSVTCIALTLAHLGPKMLERSLQFLIESAGTLGWGQILIQLRPELNKAFYLPQQLFSIKKVFSQPLWGSYEGAAGPSRYFLPVSFSKN